MSKFREIQGWDGQTLFHRILLATVRGVTSKTAVECLSNQKLLHHSLHAKSQLNSYIHSKDFRVS